MIRWLRRMFFGNWRRAGVTLLVAGLVSARYFPEIVWPILGPVLQIAIMLFGIRIMLIPFWPMRRHRPTRW